jgi:hypothetical protein
LEEVLQRKDNPNTTIFKAMSMEEQVDTIEHSTQESLRFIYERKSIEVTEAQRRGMMLLE